MAIDTATKRRAALGRSTVMLPAPTGTIGADQRAILLRLYILFAVVSVARFFVQADVEICSTDSVDVEL